MGPAGVGVHRQRCAVAEIEGRRAGDLPVRAPLTPRCSLPVQGSPPWRWIRRAAGAQQ